MNFDIPEHVKLMIEKADEFMKSEVFPLESAMLKKGFKALLPEIEKKREKVKKMGLWAPQHPKEYGGTGLSLTEFALLSEKLGKSPIGYFIFGCQAPDAGNIELLYKYGTPAQKEIYLRPLTAGKIRSTFSMTEPDTAGSNPTLLKTSAVREGDEFVINGDKWFSTGADGAAFTIVMAVTNPEAPRHARASMIIVPTDNPGFRLVKNTPVMGHAGEDYPSHGEVSFENCRVPVANLLGPEGMGFILAQDRLGPGRIHHCMRWLGMCERAFEMMCSRASTREITPGRPLSSKQIIQEWVAESAAEIQAARLMVLHAAEQVEKKGTKGARDEIAKIKYFVAGVLQKTLDRAIQVHGALGVTDYTILSYFYREERASRIYDGPDEVHKIQVAKRILKPYAWLFKTDSPPPKTASPRKNFRASSASLVDSPTDIREGEEPDLKKLEMFLKDNMPELKGKVTARQFPSGFSNLTYLIKVGDGEMVLRRPPFGKKAKTAHDMGKEYNFIRRVGKVFNYCPETFLYCEDESVIGSPFYLMERLRGVILRKDLPKGLSYSPEEMNQLCRNLLDVHLELHSVDIQAAGLDDIGRPEGYVKRQVEGWSKRYADARVGEAPSFEKIMLWLNNNMPEDSPKASVIHNDYKFDNVALDENDPTKITGVLDWEMATIGDPLMDLGGSLAYWVEKNDPEYMGLIRTLPTTEDGAMTRDETVKYYAEKSGVAVDNFDFYYVFGLFRLAGIAQQIYCRYFRGQTKDKRFANMVYGVQILEKAASEVIAKSDL